MRILVVKFQINPEFREQFMAATLEDARGANLDEPGCLRFDVIQDEADPNRIYLYEVYKDDAAFSVHLNSPHFVQWRDTVKDEWFTEPVDTGRGWKLYPADEERNDE